MANYFHETLCSRLDEEISAFRNSYKAKDYTDIYNDWYKIGFYETYYEMLKSLSKEAIELNYKIIEWLSNFRSPLVFLYDEWLGIDDPVDMSYEAMMDFIYFVYKSEQSL